MQNVVETRPRTRSAAAILAAFVVVAALYTATFTFRGITDTELNSLQTRALVLHGDIDLARYRIDVSKFQGPGGNLVVERDGHVYSVYGVGVSLLAAPFYAPLTRLGVSEHALQGTVAVAFAAAAVVVLLLVLLKVAPRRVAILCAIVFAFGTSLWPVASMAFFQQAPVLFFTGLALIGLFSASPHGSAFAGAGLGIATVVRPTMAIPLGVVGLFHLGLGRRRLFAYCCGGALPVLAVLIQTRWIWGSWLNGGYSHIGVPYNAPFGEAMGGLMIGWWRGLLIYTPFSILGVLGWALALRRASAERERALAFLGISVCATILLYSRWADWGGGLNQFGYRLLLETVPFLLVLTAYALTRLPKLVPFGVVAGAISVLTMTWGAAPAADAWDSVLFVREISEAPISRAWGNLFDHPGPSLARLAAVVAASAILAAIARRVDVKAEPG